MDNRQYHNLMFHTLYTESLLESIFDSVNAEGGVECPICGKKSRVYLPAGVNLRKNALCPHCQSLERHRALWLLLQNMNWHKKGMRILHFAPESFFYQIFSSQKDIDYWSVDLNPNMYGVRKAVDITDITFDDNSFDMIICNHVLEHIPDDKKAMSELYRVLKPNDGIAFLNVPMSNAPTTLENPAYNTPELRIRFYGQADHVRMYGLDYVDRLKAAGFKIQMFTLDDTDGKLIKKYGLDKNEKIFLCRK